MENMVIVVSVVMEMLITSWMFDGLVHWSDHLHAFERKMSERFSLKKNPDAGTSEDPQPDIVNG